MTGKDNNWVIDLLEKTALGSKDQARLDAACQNDPDVQALVETYRQIEEAIARGSRIPMEVLGEYILIRNGVELDQQPAQKWLTKIEAHLAKDPASREELGVLEKEYSELDAYLKEKIPVEATAEPDNLIRVNWLSSPLLRYGAVATVLMLMLPITWLTMNADLSRQNQLNLPSDSYVTRGMESPALRNGLIALNQQKYPQAVEAFNLAITDTIEHTRFYSAYLLGLSHLALSEKSIFGISLERDQGALIAAREAFELSLSSNTDPRYLNLKLKATYYLGRVQLLLGEKESAIQLLKSVVNQNGPDAQTANEILSEMHARVTK